VWPTHLAVGQSFRRALQVNGGVRRTTEMRSVARTVVGALVGSAGLFGIFISTFGNHHDRQRDRAWFRWYKDPNPTTLAEFQTEEQRAMREELMFLSASGGLVVAGGWLMRGARVRSREALAK
jgi:hypothetical protein